MGKTYKLYIKTLIFFPRYATIHAVAVYDTVLCHARVGEKVRNINNERTMLSCTRRSCGSLLYC